MRFAWSILLCIQAVLCFAQNEGFVRGRVTDADTQEPLFGVHVIYGKGSGTITSPDGTYSFAVRAGTVSISFQFVGYKTVTESVKVKAKDTAVLNVALETDVYQIDQIVVSADRMEKKASDLTVTMNVIKQEYLSRIHIKDAEELMNRIPGIEVLDGQASVRGGSGFSYGVGSRVLALVDGLPLMAADGGNIKWNFLPLEQISQVEVIKGASSVLYGSSALNGVINFRTADATNIPQTTFFAESGVFDKPEDKIKAWWHSPRIFSSASFSHLRRAGFTDVGLGLYLFKENSYRKFNDEQYGRISVKIKHHSARKEGLAYGANVSAERTYKTDFVLWENAGAGALKQDTSSVSSLYQTFFTVDPFVSLVRTTSARHDLRFRILGCENSFPVRKQNDARFLSAYGEYQIGKKIADVLQLISGFSASYSIVDSRFFGDHHGMNLAGFAQLEAQPVKKLRLVAGVRLEQNSLDDVNDKIVPVFRSGINFQAGEYTFLRVSFGQGYRYPSVAEKYASTTLGSVKIYPNTGIQSEKGWSAETGIKQGFMLGQSSGQVDLCFFYTRNSNMIEFLFGLYPDPVTGISGPGFRAENFEQAMIYGSEIEFTLTRNFNRIRTAMDAGYSYIYPVEFSRYTGESTGQYLKYRRKHSGNMNISISGGKIVTGLHLFARSRILRIDDIFLNEITGEQILPGFPAYWKSHNKGYLLVDGDIGYLINRRLTVSLVVKNLTNVEYMGRPGDIQPVRNFSLRLSGRF
jgi:iron complex outermembrane receptor protein